MFVGNPGTGKTTVARLVAGIYRALGLLSKGHLVEVDRSELVAGYLGQTADEDRRGGRRARWAACCSSTRRTRWPSDQYGAEAVDTLVKEMEDHRDDLVVIVAGYPGPMARFVASNPGLESRFRTTIEFDDYTDDELRRDLRAARRRGRTSSPTPECLDAVPRRCCATPIRDEGFGNGRYARNLLEAAIGRHAWRLRDVEQPTVEQLRELVPEDLVEPPELVEFGPETREPAVDKDGEAGEDTEVAPHDGEGPPAETAPAGGGEGAR